MKNQFKYFLIVCLVFIQIFYCKAQNSLNDKFVLLSFMKVNNFSLDEKFFVTYLKITKPREYKLYRNDEFNYPMFYKNSKNEYENELNNLDFSTRFVKSKIIDIGGYSFENESFPLFINYSDFFGYLIPSGLLQYGFKDITCEIFNSSYIRNKLKMNHVNAETFIQKRKNINGNVDRKILAKIEFSIMNLKNKEKPSILTLYIHKITLTDNSGVLGVITPDINYYDKINGIKLKDGQEKIYYDNEWNELSSANSSSASFYRIIKYKDGMIDNPVIDYYISGATQMIGNYYKNLRTKHGFFQFFYENGQKSAESNMTINKLNGKHQSWYSNGNKKEEVNYVYDKKDGCDYLWDENGKCKTQIMVNGQDYFSYYENGKVEYKPNCPCVKLTAQNIAETNANNNFNQDNENNSTVKLIGGINNVIKGKKIYNDGSIYEGELKNGIRDGFGTVTYNDGKIYIGYFKNDKRDSIGKVIFPIDPKYSSAVKSSTMEGIFKNDEIYNGIMTNIDWKDRKQELIIKEGVMGKWKKVK